MVTMFHFTSISLGHTFASINRPIFCHHFITCLFNNPNINEHHKIVALNLSFLSNVLLACRFSHFTTHWTPFFLSLFGSLRVFHFTFDLFSGLWRSLSKLFSLEMSNKSGQKKKIFRPFPLLHFFCLSHFLLRQILLDWFSCIVHLVGALEMHFQCGYCTLRYEVNMRNLSKSHLQQIKHLDMPSKPIKCRFRHGIQWHISQQSIVYEFRSEFKTKFNLIQLNFNWSTMKFNFV